MTRPRRRWLLLGAGVLVVVLLVAPIVFTALVWTRIDRMDLRLPGSAAPGTTYLLVGSDSRAEVRSAADRRRYGDAKKVIDTSADLMLLLHVAPDGTLSVLSLPRDLVVTTANGDIARLGPLLNDGTQTLVDTLCRSLGVGVDHVALLDLLQFTHVVDAVGGVDVYLDHPTRDRKLGLRLGPGPNHLDGRAALTFVRMRHVDERIHGAWVRDSGSTLDRGRRAREVLTQVGKRIPGFTDPFGLARTAWTVSGAVSVDDASGIGDLRALERALTRIGSSREVDLAVDLHPGKVPIAWLEPAGASTLSDFAGGDRRGRCASPTAPVVS